MLIDKAYYDYDFESKQEKVKRLLYEDTVRNDEQTHILLSKFGIGCKREKSLKDLQAKVIDEMQLNNNN